MADRLFLHVGTPKSGTTFLQAVWWTNKDALREQGLLLPGRGVQRHFWASCVVRGEQQRLQGLPPVARRTWGRLLELSAEFDGDVLISHELFSAAAADRADAALRELEQVADEVHVVVTARDLVRQIPAEWQQRTKHGRSQHFTDFVEEVRTDPGSNFWRVQDVAQVLERWSSGLPGERIHLVVLPPPGASSTFLWDQMCALTGVDGTGMPEQVSRRNESLGLAEAEAMRRISAELQNDDVTASTRRLLKGWFVENILRSSDPERIVLPPSAYPWVLERSRRMVDEISGRGYQVIGDLEHLVASPDPVPGRGFQDLDESEVTAAAIRALTRFVEHEDRVRHPSHPEPAPQGADEDDEDGAAPASVPTGLLDRLRGRG